MNENHSSEHSKTDWEYVKNLQDTDIDLSDIPEITEAQMVKAVLRIVRKTTPNEIIRAMNKTVKAVGEFDDSFIQKASQNLLEQSEW